MIKYLIRACLLVLFSLFQLSLTSFAMEEIGESLNTIIQKATELKTTCKDLSEENAKLSGSFQKNQYKIKLTGEKNIPVEITNEKETVDSIIEFGLSSIYLNEENLLVEPGKTINIKCKSSKQNQHVKITANTEFPGLFTIPRIDQTIENVTLNGFILSITVGTKFPDIRTMKKDLKLSANVTKIN